MAMGLFDGSVTRFPTEQRRDTSRHSIECLCRPCEVNGTGQFAQREVLRAAKSRVLTGALYGACVALCMQRGASPREGVMANEIDWGMWGRSIVRPAREGRRWTRQSLAERSGVAESTIRNVEMGHFNPTGATVTKLCMALGLAVPWGSPALLIVLDRLSRDATKQVLRLALSEFIQSRSDAAGYVARIYPDAKWDEVPTKIAEVEGQAEIAATVLEQLADEGKE